MSPSEIWQARPETEQVLRAMWEEERLAGRKREYLKKVSSHGLKAARTWLEEEEEIDRVERALLPPKPQHAEINVVNEEPPPRPKKLRVQSYGHELTLALDALYNAGISRPKPRQVMKWWQDNPLPGLIVDASLKKFTYEHSEGKPVGVDHKALGEAIGRRFAAS